MKETTKVALVNTKSRLDAISPQMIHDLNRVVNGDWGLQKNAQPSQVHALDLEIFVDGYRVVLYPMDNRSTQLGYKGLLEEFPDGPLSGHDVSPDLDQFDFTSEEDNKELNLFDEEVKQMFLDWFQTCWKQTENAKLAKPIYLMFHDSDELLDLRTKKWIDVNERWG